MIANFACGPNYFVAAIVFVDEDGNQRRRSNRGRSTHGIDGAGTNKNGAREGAVSALEWKGRLGLLGLAAAESGRTDQTGAEQRYGDGLGNGGQIEAAATGARYSGASADQDQAGIGTSADGCL